MNKKNILDQLQNIFRDCFDDENLVVVSSTTSDDVEGWDSVAHINLIVTIEKEYNIKFSLAELAVLYSVDDIVNLIAEKAA